MIAGCAGEARPTTATADGADDGSDAGVDGDDVGTDDSGPDDEGPDDGPGDDGPDDGPGDGDGDGDGDGEQPPESPFTLDHVQMRGTHNSYHQAPLFAFDASHEYTHVPLDQQLGEQGVRVLELDLHNANSDDTIDVYHIMGIDARSTCPDFETCLRTLRGWSEQHPLHVPVIVWVEAKDDTGGPAFDNLDRVDEVLRAELGDRLLTPDDVQGSAASLHEAVVAGWPRIDTLRGKFAFVVLSSESDIDQYTQGYTTTAGRAMFPRVGADRFESPVAAFCKLGIGEPDVVAAAHAAKLMIATNVCAVNDSDETCEQSRLSAIAQGIHMLKDDLPAPIAGRSYFMALPDGKPVACNPVRAPDGCSAEALEAL